MSVEKLRADVGAERDWYERNDIQHSTTTVTPDFSQWFEIFLALLDEHAAEEEQTDLALRNERHDRAEALIQAYGEDE